MDPDEYLITYRHFRVNAETGEVGRYMRGETKWQPTPNGGGTLCLIFDGDTLLSWGLTECSMKDNFSYEIGRNISRGRALKQLDGQPLRFQKPENSLLDGLKMTDFLPKRELVIKWSIPIPNAAN